MGSLDMYSIFPNIPSGEIIIIHQSEFKKLLSSATKEFYLIK